MTPIKFNEFRHNVETWAAARGIYQHSTPRAQALKAVSEAGELADAVIKGDRAAMIDAIGDIAVCVVNAALMAGEVLRIEDASEEITTGDVQLAAAWVADRAAGLAVDIGGVNGLDTTLNDCMGSLLDMCAAAGVPMEDCCAAAWNEIKDRTGRMVASGAFVKD